ncbi:MAG: hypothetical protein KJ646_04145, partial [Nanoarchaeota archaeon]|nr:hypothetical protein [Nanoarchaeota archaeon]
LLFYCKMLKKQKVKKENLGSEVAIHQRLKTDRINNAPIPLDLKPKSVLRLRTNPGGAII